MTVYNYVTVDTIISKALREGLTSVGFNESDTIEMIGEALEAIGATAQLEEGVEFLELKDHAVALPSGLAEIIQVAYSPEIYTAAECTKTVEEGNTDNTCQECDTTGEETEECWSCHNKYYIPEQRYYDVIRDYPFVSNFNTTFYKNYRPLSLNTSTFRSSLGLHCDKCINVDYTSEDSYHIQDGRIVSTLQEGSICLAYLKYPTDENGYPKIPDNYSYREAITRYIKMKIADAEFFGDPSPANEKRFSKYESDWHWYCRQAKNKALMPQNVTEREALHRVNMRMIKLNKEFYNFYGNNGLERFRLNGRR